MEGLALHVFGLWAPWMAPDDSLSVPHVRTKGYRKQHGMTASDLARLKTLHKKIAEDAKLPPVVHCRRCGAELGVDPAECLAHGWPVCCHETMALGMRP